MQTNSDDSKKDARPSFRDDLALGTAGFIAGVDGAIGTLIPGRVIHLLTESEMVFRQTYAFLEKNLPGGKKGTER